MKIIFLSLFLSLSAYGSQAGGGPAAPPSSTVKSCEGFSCNYGKQNSVLAANIMYLEKRVKLIRDMKTPKEKLDALSEIDSQFCTDAEIKQNNDASATQCLKRYEANIALNLRAMQAGQIIANGMVDQLGGNNGAARIPTTSAGGPQVQVPTEILSSAEMEKQIQADQAMLNNLGSPAMIKWLEEQKPRLPDEATYIKWSAVKDPLNPDRPKAIPDLTCKPPACTCTEAYCQDVVKYDDAVKRYQSNAMAFAQQYQEKINELQGGTTAFQKPTNAASAIGATSRRAYIESRNQIVRGVNDKVNERLGMAPPAAPTPDPARGIAGGADPANTRAASTSQVTFPGAQPVNGKLIVDPKDTNGPAVSPGVEEEFKPMPPYLKNSLDVQVGYPMEELDREIDQMQP